MLHFKAKVERLYVHSNGVSIRLKGKGDGYFDLPNGHQNYHALYSLALLAVAKNFTLWIRTTEERAEQSDVNVDLSYMVIER